MTKRIFSLILTIAMLCAFVPCVASADTSGTCGDNLTWSISGGTLTISGTGTMSMSWNSVPWADNKSTITRAVIENGVTDIGSYAFDGCSVLTSVTIPDSVVSIGNCAFRYCGALTSISLPANIVTIGEWAFQDCTGLTSMTIPSGVVSISNEMFYGCTGLTSVVIPSGVITIGKEAFRGCSGLRAIDIPDSVITIGSYAFYGCGGLKTVTVPDKVTKISDHTFYNCTGLTSVTLGSNITVIDNYAFEGCSQLESINLPYSLTTVGWKAFYNCKSLTTVYYAGSVEDWQSVNIDSNNDNLTNAAISYGSAAPVVTTTASTPTYTTLSDTVSVVLNGVTLTFDYPPTIIDGRTLVPLRKIFESIGATVTWDDATKTVISTYNGVTITLTIGSNILYKNGYPIELDVPAQLLSDYTMVPVRAIAESFGAEVTWDANTRTVGITTY